MLKAIKLRLYPNKEQEIYINKLLGCSRFVYNNCLAFKQEKYTNESVNVGLKELGKFFHNDLTKNKDFEWLNEHNTKVLKQSIINMLDGYKRFFVNGSGFPNYKKKNQKQSCRFPSEAISKRNDFTTGKIDLVKQLKGLKFKCSDDYKKYLIKNQEGIKSATLHKTKSGNYFLSVLIDGEFNKVLTKPINQSVGLDLGIKDFVICSNGKSFENIKIQRSNKLKLRKLHQNLSRKMKGSKNKEKARIKLAKFNEKLNNIKENYLHLVSNQIINENQVISIEDLNVKGMLKNHKLARSMQELSLNRFKSMLEYKAIWYGRTLIQIDRWFPSSQLCSTEGCDYRHKELKLSDRDWICPCCGSRHDRDINSAINIEIEGNRLNDINRASLAQF